MNLDELKAVCEAQVDIAKQTQKEIDEAKSLIAKRVRANFDSYVKPLANLYTSVYLMVDKVACLKSFDIVALDDTGCFLGRSQKLGFTSSGCSTYELATGFCNDILSHSDDTVCQRFKCYSAADETMKLADKLRSEITKRFEKMADILKEENEKLSATLSELKASLEQSSTVEQVSENTVRVQIGGKTYIGTLEEN